MRPVLIHMHPADNGAIVGNDGLSAGTALPNEGVTLRDKVPQAHKVALQEPPAG